MTIKDFKKIARLLKEVYKEIEKEASENGMDIFSPEYEELISKAREAVLEKMGFTLEEYRTAKEEASPLRKQKEDLSSLLDEARTTIEKVNTLKIPTAEEIEEIVNRIAQEHIKEVVKEVVVTNEIIKEIEKPTIIKETIIEKEEYDDSKLHEELEKVNKRFEDLPEPINVDKVKEDVLTEFGKMFEDKINILGMPDFRKLAMGLQQQIDANTAAINAVEASDVDSVTGTTDRITATPTTGSVVVDIASTYVGQTSITTLGTITTGVWNGTTVSVGFGGTGTGTAFTAGSIVFASASGVYTQNNSNFFWDNTNIQLKIGSNSIVNGNSLNPIAIAKTSTSYLATYIQNLSSGTAASTDLIIGNNADDGTVSTGTYLDMGINSSGYTGSGLTNGPGDAYIFNNLEDIIIGTGTAGKNVIIGTNIFGGSAASKTRATFTDTGLQMMDGTAANPSISFAGSTTTGLYESSSGVLGVSIAGTSRLTHSATSWDLNSSNGGAISIGGTAQFMDISGSVTPSAATSQGFRSSTFKWTPDVDRTAIFGFNNATTVGGTSTGRLLTNLVANRAGNAFADSIGITVTNSSAFEARDVNNQSSGTVVVTNNYGFAVLQNFTMSTTLNAAFVSTMTANSARWNLYMSGTAQNWLEGSTGIGISVPTAKLHVVQSSLGTAVAKFISTATNDDPESTIYQNRIPTTNATQTTLHTFATATNTSYSCYFRVVGRRTGGAGGTAGDWADYEVKASVNNIAGTVTVDAVTTTALWESQAGWDATVTVSGTNFLLRVTGAASNNVTWHLSYSLVSPLST